MMTVIEFESAARSAQWVVVNTHPHRENLALENLARQQFTTYCPLITKRIKHARRVQDVLRPLFPSYVFVQINAHGQHWRPIRSTLGIRSLVSFGEQLSYLDDGFIQSLKAREIEGAIVRPESPFRIGQQVRMAGGSFDGLVATIIAMDEKDRLMVLMDLLNRPVKVKVDASKVRAM
jgi:transcriptional antiterminator RfaH